MGWGGALAVLALTAGSQTATPPAKDKIQVNRAWVALGDIWNVSTLPAALRAQAASLELARFRRDQSVIVESTQRLAERARGLMPVLGPWLERAPPRVIEIQRSAAAARRIDDRRACLKVVHTVAAGDYPTGADFVPEACGAHAQTAELRYDARTRTVRASSDLSPGELVEAPPPGMLAAVRPATKLFLTTKAGPVTVSREVRAIQASGAGRAVFVQAQTGEVFAAPSPEAPQ